jgi:hypothetical protein
MGLFKKNKTTKTYYLNHESGLDGFPRTATKATLDEEEKNITFSQLGLKIKVCVPLESITSCEKYTEKELKEKSVIGRAAVGGLLFGGVGAVVGAVSGTKPKEKTLYYMTLTYTDNNEEKTLLFRIEQMESLELIRRIQELKKA